MSYSPWDLPIIDFQSPNAPAEFCRSLYDGGVRDFHFYTLNRADQAYAVCHLLGLRPKS